MIRFGPAGIPLSCKGRTLRDGIEDVHTLGLNAMEVQLVRTNVMERLAGEEEVGLTPRQVQEELVVEIVRGKDERIFNMDETIKRGDTLRVMVSGIARDHEQLKRLGALARDLDVRLALHTPYYMDLVTDDDITHRSLDSIMWGAALADELGGTVLVTHLGLYGEVEPSAALKKVGGHLKDIVKWWQRSELKVKLGIEPSGRQEVIGDFSEVLHLCKEAEGVVPILNFPHIHARGNGSLKTKEDFQRLFDETERYFKGEFYTHFSGVEHEEGNEIRYTPIKKGDLKFEPLAECILDGGFNITIISGSPLLEHDAMYMKVILERILARRRTKPVPPPKPAAKAPVKPAKPAAKGKKVVKAPAKAKKPAKSPVKGKKPSRPSTKAKKVVKPAKKISRLKKAAKPKKTAKPARKAAKKTKPRKPGKKPAKKSVKKASKKPSKKAAKPRKAGKKPAKAKKK
jgi:deoxyribonuclease-4